MFFHTIYIYHMTVCTFLSIFVGSMLSDDEHSTQSHHPEEETGSSKEHDILGVYVIVAMLGFFDKGFCLFTIQN